MNSQPVDYIACQADLAERYQGGAPGVAVSGLVWVAAAIATWQRDVSTGFIVLFVGGMAIVPLGQLIARVGFHAPPPAISNPLERTALESTFGLFAGIACGFLLLAAAPEYVFAAVAMTIGARYFLFRTVYGNQLYWMLGGGIAVIGIAAAFVGLLSGYLVPLTVGVFELVMAVVIFVRWREQRI